MSTAKYADKADISVLVVEKNVDPMNTEDTRHNIGSLSHFLSGYGFSVDLTWSLSKYQFEDFEVFYQGIVGQLEEDVRKAASRKDDLKEIFERLTKDKLEDFVGWHDVLRKSPINSFADLDVYDFLILHPDFDDSCNIVRQVLKAYPTKPIIMPSGSVATGTAEGKAKRIRGLDVGKSPGREVYILYEEGCSTVIDLMEYLLDKRKKLPQNTRNPE